MKNQLLKLLFLFLALNLSNAQQWMTSLPVAQDLALVQNKMVLMVWEESTNYPYSILVNDDKGRTIRIKNLFEDENVSSLIWKSFVPVIVSETMYTRMYNKIKNSHAQSYIDKFHDNSIKILDANGNILNVSRSSGYLLNQNISDIILTYALETEFMETELRAYRMKKDFYSAYYLASKYLDYALYAKGNNKSDFVGQSDIYLDDSINLLASDSLQNKTALKKRAELLKLQGDLMLRHSTKEVLKELRRLEKKGVEEINESMLAFLYFTSYACMGDMRDANAWRSKVSSLDLKKAQLIINIIKS